VAQLAHPDPTAALVLVVDVSDHLVGTVLTGDFSWPSALSFFSKKLDSAQMKYSSFDEELLAVNLTIRHFRWVFEGCRFHVKSDHKQLSFALHQTSDAGSARQQCHLSYIAEYT